MKNVAIFGDLTALYNVRASMHKNINYNLLDKALKDEYGVANFSCAKWYTLFHPDNVKQGQFVKTLESLKWEVQTKRPSEIRRSIDPECNPHKDYRFDSEIAYDIGESTADDQYSDIVIVSDSFELLKPLKRATKYIDSISVAFFADAMERRWWRELNDSGINFLDLSELMYKARKNMDGPETVRY